MFEEFTQNLVIVNGICIKIHTGLGGRGCKNNLAKG